jgi:hypothetical protein
MELWTEIRRRVLGEELSKRPDCREYDLHWDTLRLFSGRRNLNAPFLESLFEL